ncbi:MAG: OmpH family outer membrane protein [Bryobacteraceae bacterium]
MLRNTLTRWLVAVAGAAVLCGTAAAQIKVAVVDMQQAVLGAAQVRKALADMEAQFKPRQAQLEQLRSEIDGIGQRLQGGRLPQQTANDLRVQAQRKQRDYERLAQDAQEELEAERNDLFTRNGQQMREVVRKLADERGFDLVVEAGSTLFAKPALDITRDAITAFDVAHPLPK